LAISPSKCHQTARYGKMMMVGGIQHSGLSIRRVSDMDNGRHDSAELSIPSFATERCRAMTSNLIRTLDSIPPTDDGALEDRALACFVVACGELALMRSTGHRDTVVEQLTAVARKLVIANAAIPKPKLAPNKVVPNQVIPNQAQGLAQVLMRGLVRDAAPDASKGPALQPALRPKLVELTVDPPEIPAWGAQDEVMQEDMVQKDLVQKDLVQDVIAPHEAAQAATIEAATVRAETVQDEIVESEAVQVKTVEAETAQDEKIEDETVEVETVEDETIEDETVEDKAVEDKTVHADTRADQATPVETMEIEAAQTTTDSPAGMSWDELEALIKQEVAGIESNAPMTLDDAAAAATPA
jgi:hypothetical protein